MVRIALTTGVYVHVCECACVCACVHVCVRVCIACVLHVCIAPSRSSGAHQPIKIEGRGLRQAHFERGTQIYSSASVPSRAHSGC